MKKINLGQKEVIHFIGIGGIGMSGLAQIMKNMGFKIQGSDQSKNKNTISCSKLGIKVFIGHSKKNIKNSTILVRSSAIKNKNGIKITVEVDNLSQLKQIIGLRFNRVLFDNMNNRDLKKGVKLAKKYYETEASGNINLKTIKSVAATGVDRISIGSITHSAPAIDLKLEFNL